MTLRVAVLDDYQQIAAEYGPWERLRGAIELHCFSDHVDDDDELVRRLSGFDAVVAMRERTPFTRARLERLDSLRLLVTSGMRNVALDVACARERGVVVCGTASGSESTAELTWALVLALTRHICEEDRRVREGGWQHTIGPELAGGTLGLLGLGRIGTRIAAYGRAFGMSVIAWSENLTAQDAAQRGAEAVAKDELFARSDVLSIHTLLSSRTRGLVGARELALMAPTSYLVNTSRGPIVQEQALVAALESGAIAGAALDVFDVEPLPAQHPLRSAPNTVLTPHIGYVANGNYRAYFSEIVEDIEAFLAGTPIRLLAG
jgi:phosphoglycerate dehydrogenase-like enzyme